MTTTTGVFLYGGVGTLSFNSIDRADRHVGQHRAVPDRDRRGEHAAQSQQPSIYINNITNLVFNSASTTIPTTRR